VKTLATLLFLSSVSLSAAAQELLVNGSWDADASFWLVDAPGATTLVRDPRDAAGSPSSGAGLVTNAEPGAQQGSGIGQCVSGVVGGAGYSISGKVMIPSGQARTGSGQIGLRWYANASCSGDNLGGPRLQTQTLGTWVTLSAAGQKAPANARSVEFVAFPSKVEAGGQLQVLFDALSLKPDGALPPSAPRHAFRVRAFATVSAAEALVGDRAGANGDFWFAEGLYESATGFYVPVVRRLATSGATTAFTLDSAQSFFASAVRRAPDGVVWTLVPRSDANASILYRLDPATRAVAKTTLPFRARSLELDPNGAVPWVGGPGKIAKLASGALTVYDVTGFGGVMSRFDSARRLWLSMETPGFAAFTAANGNVDVYADAGTSMISPDVDESGLVWAMNPVQDRLLRFSPASRQLTEFPLVNASPNWARLAATGDRVDVVAAYGPHVLSHVVSQLAPVRTSGLAAPVSTPFGISASPAAPTNLTATSSDATAPFEERTLYAEDDAGRGLFTSADAGYAALVWARGGETLTSRPIQWWRPLTASDGFTTRAALPVAVEVRPADPTSNFFTEVTLTNVDAAPTIDLVYRASGIDYEAAVYAAPGQTLVFANVIQALRGLGEAIPAGSTAGTLTARFANGSGRLAARVSTRFPDGSSTGLGYAALDPAAERFAERKSLNGLKQTAGFRTNVAAVNLCASDGPCPTLELQATFTDDATGAPAGTRSFTLAPREWKQVDAPLAALGRSGETFSVVFTPLSAGFAGFDAYATVIDNANGDASFFRAASLGGGSTLTLPVATDAGGVGTRFTSECAITNTSGRAASADLTFTSAKSGSSVHETVVLPSAHGLRYPNAVAHFRGLDPSKVEADDFGPIRIAFRDFATGFASERTVASNGTGLGFTALDPYVARGQRKKRITGLKENGSFRTNLAVVHLGATTQDPAATIDVKVTIVGPDGTVAGAPLTATLAPGRLTQWNRVLSIVGASGTGWSAIVERTAGQDAFDAYVTVIDNASSDPTFLRAE
jgi:hypothetical protein